MHARRVAATVLSGNTLTVTSEVPIVYIYYRSRYHSHLILYNNQTEVITTAMPNNKGFSH